MGRHLAKAIQRRGHKLTWVQCPEEVQTASDLLKRLRRELPKQDVLVMAAAICDVRPEKKSPLKIKKAGLQTLRLVKNPDVTQELSKLKKPFQTFVGFALESKNIQSNALQKMRAKRLELILAQRVTSKITPFGDTRIEGTLYAVDGSEQAFKSAKKEAIADTLIGRAEGMARQKLRLAH